MQNYNENAHSNATEKTFVALNTKYTYSNIMETEKSSLIDEILLT